MRTAAIRLAAFAALLVTLALLAGACSAPGSSSLNDSTEPIDQDAARQLFQTSCRACHSLSDASSAGVFGPDLDLLQPDATVVRRAIEDGPGPMPDDLLTGANADLVARYVAEVAGANPDAEGEGGTRGNASPTKDE